MSAPGVTSDRPASPGDALTPGQRFLTVLTLGLIVMLGPFTIDMYLPAFPEIAAEFGASEASIQLTLTGTLLGFGLGQLLVGPLSDRVGRRLPIILATALHVVASIGIAFAPDVAFIGIIRVVQGMAAASCGVVAQATIRDLFQGQRLVRMLARLALVSGLGPILAPFVGSQLLRFVEWRGVFWFLAGWGVFVFLLAAFRITETRPKAVRQASNGSVLARYRRLLSDRVFVGVVLVGALGFAGVFTYVSSSSFLFQDYFGLDPQAFGFVFAANAVGLALSNQISARVMRRVSPGWVIAVTLSIMLLAATAIVVGGLLGGGMWAVMIPLFVFMCGAGATFPAVQVTALAPHGEDAGTAASLLGATNFAVSGTISPIAGAIGITPVTMGAVQLCSLAAAIAVLWLIVRPWRVPKIAD